MMRIALTLVEHGTFLNQCQIHQPGPICRLFLAQGRRTLNPPGSKIPSVRRIPALIAALDAMIILAGASFNERQRKLINRLLNGFE